MEVIQLFLGRDEEYDRLVHGTDGIKVLPDQGDLSIATKDKATASGRAGAVIAFTVVVDGKPHRAQTVMTVRNLKMALASLTGRYDEDGKVNLSASTEKGH